jgi:hypothetical protein
MVNATDRRPILETVTARVAVRRRSYGAADVAVFLGTLTLLAAIARLGSGTLLGFSPAHQIATISLDPHNLPYYVGRSVLRRHAHRPFCR